MDVIHELSVGWMDGSTTDTFDGRDNIERPLSAPSLPPFTAESESEEGERDGGGDSGLLPLCRKRIRAPHSNSHTANVL